MIPPKFGSVIASRDGSHAMLVVDCSGIQMIPNKVAKGPVFTVRLDDDTSPISLVVPFSFSTDPYVELRAPRYDLTMEEATLAFAFAVIGDHLDANGRPEPDDPNSDVPMIWCRTYEFDSWEGRKDATDQEVFQYIEAKLRRAWQYDRTAAVFGAPDQIRLNVSLAKLRRIAQLGVESHWNEEDVGPGALAVTPTPEFLRQGASFARLSTGEAPATRTSSIDIFISHSSADQALAKKLIEFLQAALDIDNSHIRCTSVDGYRLPVGSSTDESLKQDILESKVLIGLITPTSVDSKYVLLELGARWGTPRPMFPLLARGANPALLSGPLANVNALYADNTSHLDQFVGDIAAVLNKPLKPANEFERQREAVVTASRVDA